MKNNGGKVNLNSMNSHQIKVNRKTDNKNTSPHSSPINPDYDQYYGLKLNKIIINGFKNVKNPNIFSTNTYNNKNTFTENNISSKNNKIPTLQKNKNQPNICRTMSNNNTNNATNKNSNIRNKYQLPQGIKFRKIGSYKKNTKIFPINKNKIQDNSIKYSVSTLNTNSRKKKTSQNIGTKLCISKSEVQYPINYTNQTTRGQYKLSNTNTISNFNELNLVQTINQGDLGSSNEYQISSPGYSENKNTKMSDNKSNLTLSNRRNNEILSPDLNDVEQIIIKPNIPVAKIERNTINSYKSCYNFYKEKKNMNNNNSSNNNNFIINNANSEARKNKNVYCYYNNYGNGNENIKQNFEEKIHYKRKQKSINGNEAVINKKGNKYISQNKINNYKIKLMDEFCYSLEEFIFFNVKNNFDFFIKRLKIISEKQKQFQNNALLLKRLYTKDHDKNYYKERASSYKFIDSNYNDNFHSANVNKQNNEKPDSYKSILKDYYDKKIIKEVTNFLETPANEKNDISIERNKNKNTIDNEEKNTRISCEKYNTNYKDNRNSIYIPKKTKICKLSKSREKNNNNLNSIGNSTKKTITSTYFKRCIRKIVDTDTDNDNNRSQDMMLNMRRTMSKNNCNKNKLNFNDLSCEYMNRLINIDINVDKLNQTNDDIEYTQKGILGNVFNLKVNKKQIYRKKIQNRLNKKKLHFSKPIDKNLKIHDKALSPDLSKNVIYNSKNNEKIVNIFCNKNGNDIGFLRSPQVQNKIIKSENNENKNTNGNIINNTDNKNNNEQAININEIIKKNDLKNNGVENNNNNNNYNNKQIIKNIELSEENFSYSNSLNNDNYDYNSPENNEEIYNRNNEIIETNNENQDIDNNGMSNDNNLNDDTDESEDNIIKEIIVKDVSTRDKRLNVFIKYIESPQSKIAIENQKKMKYLNPNNHLLVEISTDSITLSSIGIRNKNFTNKTDFYLNNYYSDRFYEASNKNNKMKLHKILTSIIEEEEKSKANGSINNSMLSEEDNFHHMNFNNYFIQSIKYLTGYLQNILDDKKRDYAYILIKSLKKKKNNSYLNNLINQKKLQKEKSKFQQNENGEVVLMDENEEESHSEKSNGNESNFHKNEKNLSMLSADECYYFNDKKFNTFSIIETPCENQEEMIKNNLSYISINDGSNGDNLEIIIKKVRLVQKVLQSNQKKNLRKKWKLKNVIKIVENERNLKFLGNYFFDWKKTTENDGNNKNNKTNKNDVISENEEFVDANNIIDEFRLKIIANYSLKRKNEN